ncbi:MAG: hypothetical protein WAL50_22080 [Kineosporiaceae bacterium]
MPTFLLIGHHDQARIQLLDQLAAIAELNPVQDGDLRSFEADWRGMPLRVETVVTADLPTVVARAELADYLVPVIAEVDGPMPLDREQLMGTPPRLEVPAVFCVAPLDDADLRKLVHLETTALIRENRPRWVPRFVHTDCRAFMFLLVRSFFTDCLAGFDG